MQTNCKCNWSLANYEVVSVDHLFVNNDNINSIKWTDIELTG